jgi:hypothetical protein
MFAPKIAKALTEAQAGSTNRLVLGRPRLTKRGLDDSSIEHVLLPHHPVGKHPLRRPLDRNFDPAEGAVVSELRQESAAENSAGREPAPGVACDFSKVPAFLPDRPSRSKLSQVAAVQLSSRIQAKLILGPVDDPLEREADRIADEVMRMSDPAHSFTSAMPALRRKCSACEDEEHPLQAKMVQRDVTGGEIPASVLEVLSSPGRQLDKSTRAYFEPRFGLDLGQVRVHTDSQAAASAASVRALAYTVGHNIVFGANRFAPDTLAGRRLLAHELAHTVQQGQASCPLLTRGRAPRDWLRREIEDDPGNCTVPGVSAFTVGGAAHKQIQASCPMCFAGIPGIPGAGEKGGMGFPDLVLLWTFREARAKNLPLPSAPPRDPLDPAVCEIGEIKPITYAPGAPKYRLAVDQINRYIKEWRANREGMNPYALPVPMTSFRGLPPTTFRTFPQFILTCVPQPTTPGLYIYTCTNKSRAQSPLVVPERERATEEQKKTLRERLPGVPAWAWDTIGAAAALLVIACLGTGVCEISAITAAVGESLASIIVAGMRLPGVSALAQATEASFPQ